MLSIYQTKIGVGNTVRVIDSIVFRPTQKYILSISDGTHMELQCVYDIRIHQVFLTTINTSDQFVYNLFISFLQSQDVPQITNSPYKQTDVIEFTILNTHTYNLETLYFQTNHHRFGMNIKSQHYGYFVNVGGPFKGCIEIFIGPEESTIAQIYSEPECSFDSILNGSIETIDMVKASLQICMILFNISKFELRDNSNIECGIKNTRNPPRKITKPLSLCHLNIAKYGKTWYEQHFNAYIKDETKRKQYHEAIQTLRLPIMIPYEQFARRYRLSDLQKDALVSYYESASNWMDFFKSVPKAKHCEYLTWLPSFLDEYIKFKPTEQTWVIDITLSPIRFMLLPIQVYTPNKHVGGTRRRNDTKRKTLRNRIYVYTFSNVYAGRSIY